MGGHKHNIFLCTCDKRVRNINRKHSDVSIIGKSHFWVFRESHEQRSLIAAQLAQFQIEKRSQQDDLDGRETELLQGMYTVDYMWPLKWGPDALQIKGRTFIQLRKYATENGKFSPHVVCFHEIWVSEFLFNDRVFWKCIRGSFCMNILWQAGNYMEHWSCAARRTLVL